MPKRRASTAASSASPIPQHSAVAVTWLDASFELDKVPELMTLTTFGYLIQQDEKVVIVASEGDMATRYFRAYTAIPAGWVQDIKRLA